MTTSNTVAPVRERLIDDYGHLCVRACRKFLRPGLDKADLQQIAAVGLIKACDRYDGSLATPFEAFAWLFIIGELMHFVRDHERLIRAPRQLRKLDKRAQIAHEALVAQLAREPTSLEVAAHLGIAPQKVDEIYAYRERAVAQSLDALQGCALRPATYTMDGREDALVVQNALMLLSKTERTIVVALYAGGYSQLELADRLGYSRRHISRLHRGALKKMRQVVAANL